MIYYPYVSDKPDEKYYIITRDNKKVYSGQANASDYTIHKNEERKINTFYAIRKMNLNSGINQVLILLHFGVGLSLGETN